MVALITFSTSLTLRNIKVKSSFFIRKKINIYEEDSLDLQKVADLINELNEPLSAYEHYSRLRLDAIRNYTMMYGPLLADQVDVNQGWSWVSTPWPWEGEC